MAPASLTSESKRTARTKHRTKGPKNTVRPLAVQMKITTSLPHRLLSSLLLALSVTVYASCSEINGGTFKLLYDHSGWLLRRGIEHYVDLDKSQARVHRWHRMHELPLYADVLDEAAQRVTRGLTSEDVAWMFAVVDERWETAAGRVADDFLPVVLTLRLDQRSHIAEVFQHDNARYARRYIDPGRRKDHRIENGVADPTGGVLDRRTYRCSARPHSRSERGY